MTDLGAAIFDFDRTLVFQETMAIFLRAVAGRRVCLSACCIAGLRAAGSASARRRDVFRAELLRATLAGKSLEKVQQAAEELFSKIQWIEWVLDEFHRHREAGRRVVVATGSLSVYMSILLNRKGVFVDELLSTEMEIDGDYLTGEMATPSCTWDEKARRVGAWLTGVDGPVWGYGNLPHDREMLELTDYPEVVSV